MREGDVARHSWARTLCVAIKISHCMLFSPQALRKAVDRRGQMHTVTRTTVTRSLSLSLAASLPLRLSFSLLSVPW